LAITYENVCSAAELQELGYYKATEPKDATPLIVTHGWLPSSS
jgi:hypothetical protein